MESLARAVRKSSGLNIEPSEPAAANARIAPRSGRWASKSLTNSDSLRPPFAFTEHGAIMAFAQFQRLESQYGDIGTGYAQSLAAQHQPLQMPLPAQGRPVAYRHRFEQSVAIKQAAVLRVECDAVLTVD